MAEQAQRLWPAQAIRFALIVTAIAAQPGIALAQANGPSENGSGSAQARTGSGSSEKSGDDSCAQGAGATENCTTSSPGGDEKSQVAPVGNSPAATNTPVGKNSERPNAKPGR
jgi:hypothetical protein